MRTVRQVRQRRRKLDLQPALAGVPAHRLVPQALSFSPSAVRNSRADSHCARHCSSVRPAAARLPRLRSRPFPPRTTGTVPASRRRSARASLPRRDRSRMALACRSAGVAYPRTRPARRRRDSQACLDHPGPRSQRRRPCAQVPLRQLPLVLARAGDRARPPR